MRKYIALAAVIGAVVATPVAAAGHCHKSPPPPPPVTPTGPALCSDGLPPDAGHDGWIPASGNTNDNCDHSGDPRLNDGVDTRTRRS